LAEFSGAGRRSGVALRQTMAPVMPTKKRSGRYPRGFRCPTIAQKRTDAPPSGELGRSFVEEEAQDLESVVGCVFPLRGSARIHLT